MEKYSTYGTEDFLTDEHFLDWILAPSETSNEYWKAVFILYPACESKADEAKKIISALRIRPGKTMPADMRRQIVAHLHANADETVAASKRNHFIRSWKRYLATACVLACCATAFFFYRTPSHPTTGKLIIERAEVATAKETKITNTADKPLLVLLPDTSTVILEANAYIVYNEQTFIENREIYLRGEAFFEVVSEKDHSFRVKTDYLTTTVLGTSFRVKAAETLAKSKVTVQSGMVEVRKKTETDSTTETEMPVYLTANQEIIYSKSELQQPSSPLTPNDVPSPTFDEHFKSTPLKTVLKALSDQYHVDISVADSVLETRTITASLREMHLFEKLDLISRAAEITYRIVDGRIVFTQLSRDN